MKLIMENWRGYTYNDAVLVEGLNVKDIVMDMAQVAISTGAVAVSGGAGGDVVTDSLFAAKTAQEVLEEVMALLGEYTLLESIVTQAAQLNYGDNPDAFYQEVKGLVKKTVSSGTIGENVQEFIKDIQESAQQIINKIVRAISKWVSALLPDDFGLAGPAFEITLTNAITSAAENAYNLASKGVAALGETGKLLTDPEALQAFFTQIVQDIVSFLQEFNNIAQNPGERAGLVGSAVGSLQYGVEFLSHLYAAPPRALMKAMGVDLDTPVEDFLDMLDKMHAKDPRRLAFQKSIPVAIAAFNDVLKEWIPRAVAVMGKLISLLFASIAVFQIVMNPEERKEILKIKPGSADLSDPLEIDDLEFTPDLGPQDMQAMRECLQTEHMRLIMENWRQFK